MSSETKSALGLGALIVLITVAILLMSLEGPRVYRAQGKCWQNQMVPLGHNILVTRREVPCKD